MRLLHHRPRLRASIIAISLTTAAGGITILAAGCGSGGQTIPASGSDASASSEYAGRSYTASSITLGANGTGTLTIVAGSGATATGTLTITATKAAVVAAAAASTRQTASGSITLTGSLNTQTGAFDLTGTSSAGTAVSVAGTLPAPPATTGGSATITIGGVNYSAVFGGNGSTATPTPGPSASATPTPSPSASPTPAPVGQLTADYFPLSNANAVYQETAIDNGGTPDVSTDEYYSSAVGVGFILASPTQVQLNGVTVSKALEEYDFSGQPTSGGDVGTLYTYYTATSSAITLYGTDQTDGSGNVIQTVRYSPAEVIPLNLSIGQNSSQTVQVTTTANGVSVSSTTTISMTFNDFEVITVPAGNYTAARLTLNYTSNSPAHGIVPSLSSVNTVTEYLASNIGLVQENSVITSTSGSSGSNPPTSGTSSYAYVLTSATGATASTESRGASLRRSTAR